eukprot:11702985-Alexandrium_andersonii.AAC.1
MCACACALCRACCSCSPDCGTIQRAPASAHNWRFAAKGPSGRSPLARRAAYYMVELAFLLVHVLIPAAFS